MDKVLSALLGTIIGFLLSWLKELVQSRPRLKTHLKTGKLNYVKQEQDRYGGVIETKVAPDDANILQLQLRFDIYNIGKVGTGITDINIKLAANKEKLYYQPQISMPFDGKKLDNSAFNLESNKVCTVETVLLIRNEEPNCFLFNGISLPPGSVNQLKIEVIINALNKKKLSLVVEPISILTA